MQRQINEEELTVLHLAMGRAVWYIQYFEDALAKFVVVKRFADKRVANREADDELARIQKGTLGAILHAAKGEGIIPEAMTDRFDAFLRERNWLVHRSWKETGSDLYNNDRRMAMINRAVSVLEESEKLKMIVFGDMQDFVRSRGVDMTAVDQVADAAIRKLKGEA